MPRRARPAAPADAQASVAIVNQQARTAPGFTGRYLVSMQKDDLSDGLKLLRTKVGLKIATTSDFGGGVIRAAAAEGANAFMLERIGVAVVEAPPDQLDIIRAASDRGPVRYIARERYVHIAAREIDTSLART
jgi:hypothetical protein